MENEQPLLLWAQSRATVILQEMGASSKVSTLLAKELAFLGREKQVQWVEQHPTAQEKKTAGFPLPEEETDFNEALDAVLSHVFADEGQPTLVAKEEETKKLAHDPSESPEEAELVEEIEEIEEIEPDDGE